MCRPRYIIIKHQHPACCRGCIILGGGWQRGGWAGPPSATAAWPTRQQASWGSWGNCGGRRGAICKWAVSWQMGESHRLVKNQLAWTPSTRCTRELGVSGQQALQTSNARYACVLGFALPKANESAFGPAADGCITPRSMFSHPMPVYPAHQRASAIGPAYIVEVCPCVAPWLMTVARQSPQMMLRELENDTSAFMKKLLSAGVLHELSHVDRFIATAFRRSWLPCCCP